MPALNDFLTPRSLPVLKIILLLKILLIAPLYPSKANFKRELEEML